MPPHNSPSLFEKDERDWSLTSEQMLFLFQQHQHITGAYVGQDRAALDLLWQSPEYRALFWSMSLDEAIDRYEVMLGVESLPRYGWFLEMSEVARQNLDSLDSEDRRALYQALMALLSTTHPEDLPQVKRLFQHPHADWRMRCGKYHLLFDVDTQAHRDYQGRLLLQRALHRDHTYENL